MAKLIRKNHLAWSIMKRSLNFLRSVLQTSHQWSRNFPQQRSFKRYVSMEKRNLISICNNFQTLSWQRGNLLQKHIMIVDVSSDKRNSISTRIKQQTSSQWSRSYLQWRRGKRNVLMKIHVFQIATSRRILTTQKRETFAKSYGVNYPSFCRNISEKTAVFLHSCTVFWAHDEG